MLEICDPGLEFGGRDRLCELRCGVLVDEHRQAGAHELFDLLKRQEAAQPLRLVILRVSQALVEKVESKFHDPRGRAPIWNFEAGEETSWLIHRGSL